MVLEDHKRRGRKLIHPMLERPIHEGHWHIDRLPELFWLAFVGNRIGDRQTLELAYKMAVDIENTIKRVRADGKLFRAYLPSEHMSCSDCEREQIYADHRNAAWVSELRPHFSDMATIWKDLPFAYLMNSHAVERSDDLIAEVKSLLEVCSHRHDKRALSAQAIVVALECRTGKVSFAKGLEIPDLNAVFDFPNTEESRRAAGFVVTMCGNVVLHRNVPDLDPNFTWQRSFWNSCYRLGPCEYE